MTQNIEIDLKKVRNNKSIIITVVLLILFVLAIFYSLIAENKYFFSEADKDQNSSKTWKKDTQENEPDLLKALTLPQIKVESPQIKLAEQLIKLEQPKTNVEKPLNAPEKPIEGISDYRNYLYNVSDLIVRFLEDRDYQTQINQVQTIELPSEITKILLSMEYYREHYLTNVARVKVFPVANSWLEKFIKIEKKSDITTKKEELKAEIKTNLKLFMEYFYSEKLQQKFVE
jgi:hypothetical protein